MLNSTPHENNYIQQIEGNPSQQFIHLTQGQHKDEHYIQQFAMGSFTPILLQTDNENAQGNKTNQLQYANGKLVQNQNNGLSNNDPPKQLSKLLFDQLHNYLKYTKLNRIHGDSRTDSSEGGLNRISTKLNNHSFCISSQIKKKPSFHKRPGTTSLLNSSQQRSVLQPFSLQRINNTVPIQDLQQITGNSQLNEYCQIFNIKNNCTNNNNNMSVILNLRNQIPEKEKTQSKFNAPGQCHNDTGIAQSDSNNLDQLLVCKKLNTKYYNMAFDKHEQDQTQHQQSFRVQSSRPQTQLRKSNNPQITSQFLTQQASLDDQAVLSTQAKEDIIISKNGVQQSKKNTHDINRSCDESQIALPLRQNDKSSINDTSNFYIDSNTQVESTTQSNNNSNNAATVSNCSATLNNIQQLSRILDCVFLSQHNQQQLHEAEQDSKYNNLLENSQTPISDFQIEQRKVMNCEKNNLTNSTPIAQDKEKDWFGQQLNSRKRANRTQQKQRFRSLKDNNMKEQQQFNQVDGNVLREKNQKIEQNSKLVNKFFLKILNCQHVKTNSSQTNQVHQIINQKQKVMDEIFNKENQEKTPQEIHTPLTAAARDKKDQRIQKTMQGFTECMMQDNQQAQNLRKSQQIKNLPICGPAFTQQKQDPALITKHQRVVLGQKYLMGATSNNELDGKQTQKIECQISSNLNFMNPNIQLKLNRKNTKIESADKTKQMAHDLLLKNKNQLGSCNNNKNSIRAINNLQNRTRSILQKHLEQSKQQLLSFDMLVRQNQMVRKILPRQKVICEIKGYRNQDNNQVDEEESPQFRKMRKYYDTKYGCKIQKMEEQQSITLSSEGPQGNQHPLQMGKLIKLHSQKQNKSQNGDERDKHKESSKLKEETEIEPWSND